MRVQLGIVAAALLLVSLAVAEDVVPPPRVSSQFNLPEDPSGSGLTVGSLSPSEQADFLNSVFRRFQVRSSSGVEGFVSQSWTELVVTDTPPAGGTATPLDWEAHFVDVGTGDAAIIDGGKREGAIDGGNRTPVLDDYAAETGIIEGPIELVVVTGSPLGRAAGGLGVFRWLLPTRPAALTRLPQQLLGYLTSSREVFPLFELPSMFTDKELTT